MVNFVILNKTVNTSFSWISTMVSTFPFQVPMVMRTAIFTVDYTVINLAVFINYPKHFIYISRIQIHPDNLEIHHIPDRSNTMQLGLHYSRSGTNLSSGEYTSVGQESSTCTSCSNLDLRQSQQQLIHSHHHHHHHHHQDPPKSSRVICRANSFASPAACKPEQLMQPQQLCRRKFSANNELCGQKQIENLVLQMDDQPYVVSFFFL